MIDDDDGRDAVWMLGLMYKHSRETEVRYISELSRFWNLDRL